MASEPGKRAGISSLARLVSSQEECVSKLVHLRGSLAERRGLRRVHYCPELHHVCAGGATRQSSSVTGPYPTLQVFNRYPMSRVVVMEDWEGDLLMASHAHLHLINWKEDLTKLVRDFYNAGLVHGDLRGVNVINEALTPDSPRYWPLEGYALGRSQPGFGKQYLRDWLTSQGFRKGLESGPEGEGWTLSEEVVRETRKEYLSARDLLPSEREG